MDRDAHIRFQNDVTSSRAERMCPHILSLLEDDGLTYFAAGTAATSVAVGKQAITRLKARLGEDPAAWRWGRVHTAHWRHPLANAASGTAFDIGPAPVDGGSHTVRNTGGEMPPHGANAGTEYRIVVDFAAPDAVSATCTATTRITPE